MGLSQENLLNPMPPSARMHDTPRHETPSAAGWDRNSTANVHSAFEPHSTRQLFQPSLPLSTALPKTLAWPETITPYDSSLSALISRDLATKLPIVDDSTRWMSQSQLHVSSAKMSDRNGTSERTSLSYPGFQLPIYTPEGSPTMTTTESATLSPETSPSPFATLSDYETHSPHNMPHNALNAIDNPVEESIRSYPGWVSLQDPSKRMCDTVRNYFEDCEQLGYEAPSLVLILPGRQHDPIPVKVDVDQTSEKANDKRRRDAMASTRHRQKKRTDWQRDGRITEMGNRTLLRESHRKLNIMDRRPPPPETHGVFVGMCGRPTCTLEHPPMDYGPLELRENFYDTSAAAKSWAQGDAEYDGSYSTVQAVGAATGFGEARRLVGHSYVPVEGSWPSHGCNDQYKSHYQWPSTG